MTALRKATLQPMDGAADPQPLGPPIDVQFNPTSMRLVLASAVDRPQTPGRPNEQHLGSGSSTLTLDLHFDTADEGVTGQARSVRRKTAQVAQFMLPSQGSNQPPPRVRFHWGDFILDGVMKSYSEDIDLFSPQGVPLRAKVAISIDGQNPDFAAGRIGPGSGTAAGALSIGLSAGAVGTVGFGAGLSVGASVGVSAGAGIGIGGGIGVEASAGASFGDRTGVAIGGESAAEFSARMGLDPTAWRGVAAGLDSPLSIDAGVEIDFSSSLSAGVGVGATGGVEAGAVTSVEAQVGLAGDAQAPPRPGSPSGTAAGFALAAAGGVQAAVESVRIAETSAAASGARTAFDLAPAGAAPPPVAPGPPEQSRPPLRDAPLPVSASRPELPAAPPPPQADARSTAFGFGVPLRPRVGGAAADRSGALAGYVMVRPRGGAAAEAPVTADPTRAPWRELPAGDRARGAADTAQQALRPSKPCGCGGGCHSCRGGR